MSYTLEQYTAERAIVDRAEAYRKANATYSRGGWSSLSAELAAHPDYAACNNDMRGRVERFELLRDLPDAFAAYIAAERDGEGAPVVITTWTGDELGKGYVATVARAGNRYGARQRYGRATIGGKVYRWQGQGRGMYCTLRAIKGRAA